MISTQPIAKASREPTHEFIGEWRGAGSLQGLPRWMVIANADGTRPELYYLDLNLKYKVDPDAGNAKYDKVKKTLTIKLPVVGLTVDSQKVLDANYQKFVVDQ